MKSTKERNFADYLTSNYGGAKSSAPEIPQVKVAAVPTANSNKVSTLKEPVSPNYIPEIKTSPTINRFSPIDRFSPAAQNEELANYIKANSPEIPALSMKEIDSLDTSPVLYENKGTKVTQNMLDKWVDPNYTLTDIEKKQAKEFYGSFKKSGFETALNNLFGKKTPLPSQEISDALDILSYKLNGAKRFGYGLFSNLPFVRAGMQFEAKQNDALTDSNDYTERLQKYRDNIENTGEYTAGKTVSKLGQYVLLNKSGVLAPLQKAFSFAANPLGAKASEAVGNILADQVADTILDVVPTVADKYKEGMTFDDVIRLAIDSEGENFVFNLLGEFGPKILKGTVDGLKKVEGEQAAQIAQKLLYDNPDAFRQTLDNIVDYYKSSKPTVDAVIKNADEIIDAVKGNTDNAVKQADEVIDSVKPVEAPEIPAVKPNLPDTETIAKQTENLTPDGLKLLDGENYGYALMETPMADGSIGYTPTIHLYDSGETIPITPLKSYATEEDAIKAINDFKAPKVEYTSPVYSEKFPEPETLIHAVTGETVSPQYAEALRKLESGEMITSEEYNAIPEIIEARKNVATGSSWDIKTPEREAYRQSVTDQMMNEYGSAVQTVVDGKTKTVYNGIVNRDKRADLVFGLSGSGKSSTLVDPISYKYKSRLIDSDEAKKILKADFGNDWADGYVHKESSDIAKRMLAQAVENGENIVIPKVGDDFDKIKTLIDDLKGEGYTVYIHFNDLPPAKAAGRNFRRFATQGRFVDLDATSFKYGNEPAETFERLIKEGGADGYSKVSNDVAIGEKPVQLDGTEDISAYIRDYEGSGRDLLSGVPRMGAAAQGAEGSAVRNSVPGEVDSIPKAEVPEAFEEVAKDMSFRNVKISDTAANKNINDIVNMYSRSNATRQDAVTLKNLINDYAKTGDDATYQQIRELTARMENDLKNATYTTGRKAKGIKGEREGYKTISYPDAKRGTITDTVDSIIAPTKAYSDFEKAANAYSDSMLKNGSSEETDRLFNTMLEKADAYVKSSGNPDEAMKRVNDFLDAQTTRNTAKEVKDLPELKTKEPVSPQEIPDMRSYEDQWGPIAPYDEPIKEIPKVETPVANKVESMQPEEGQVSQFWQGGTVETVTDPKTYKETYEPLADLNRVSKKSTEYKEAVSQSRLTTDGEIDVNKVNEWRLKLATADDLEAEDIVTAMDIKRYLESQGMAEDAADLMMRIRPFITNDAQVLQTLGALKRSTLEGAVESALAKIRQATDGKQFKGGYTDAVNNVARQVEDAIKSGDTSNIADMLNQKLSNYAYGSDAVKRLSKTDIKGEQMVLNLIGGWEPDKKTAAELAEEAGSLIRKLNGVADITSKDEAQVLKLLTEASQYEKGSRQFKELQAQAAKILDAKIPTSVGEKIRTTLYDNMLGNFKTAITRNAGGNLISNLLEKAQKPLKTGIDRLVSMFTGERNYLLDPEVAAAYKAGFEKGLKDQWTDVRTGIKTTRSGEESFADALANVRNVYKGSNKASKVLGAYDNAVKTAMLFGDRPFYEAEYAAAKTELNKIVKKYGQEALTQVGVPAEALKNIDDTIEFLAHQRALEACFQKGTITADGFKKLKDALGDISRGFIGTDMVTQFSMPFIQVPANMMERFADYLPGVGLLKNALQTGGEVATGNFNQRRFVDALSRQITGLGLFGGGVALANNAANGGDGFGITGGYSKDADKAAAERAAGELQYALQLPNGYQIDISDIPVLGPMIQASSKYAEATRDGENGLVEGGKEALSSALETSALQGLNRMLGTNQYGGGSIGENVANVIGQGAGQIIPSLVRQTAQVVDPYKRDLGQYGTTEYLWNNVINSTPFRGLLDPKLDNEGNYIEQNQGRNVASKALENYLLPWQISKPEYTDLGETANEIYEESSDNTAKAYPTVPKRSDVRDWLGDNYSSKAYHDIKEQVGTLNTELGEAVIDAPFFQNLDADEQANVLSDMYSAIKAVVREENEDGYVSNNKLAAAYKEGDIEGAVEYLASKYSIKQNNISSSDKNAQEAYAEGGQEGLDNYIGVTQEETRNSQQSIADKYPSFDATQIQNSKSKNVDADKAIPYLRDLGVNDFAEMGEILYNNATRSVNAISAYNNLGGYAGVGLYYAMQADAKALNPGGSANSLDKQEIALYLTNLGYDLAGINKVYEALGKNAISEKDYAKYLGKSNPGTKKSSSKSTTSSSEFDSSFLRQYSNQRSGLSSDFLRSYGK